MNAGEKVNRGLRLFNIWFDGFLLEAARPLAMLGFAMGTVDIFTRGGMAPQAWFAVGWAIIQAITIDGLFFAVWYRIGDTKWEPGKRFALVGLWIIGSILGAVAFATNAILGFQQLWGIADSQTAMLRLGIDPALFTLIRAILVVAVSIMVAFVYQRSIRSALEVAPVVPVAPTVAQPSVRIAPVSTDEQPRSTPEHSARLLEGPHSKETIQSMLRQDRSINLSKLSVKTGVAYSTLTKWRRELAAEAEEENDA